MCMCNIYINIHTYTCACDPLTQVVHGFTAAVREFPGDLTLAGVYQAVIDVTVFTEHFGAYASDGAGEDALDACVEALCARKGVEVPEWVDTGIDKMFAEGSHTHTHTLARHLSALIEKQLEQHVQDM
jgi:hypothetical protein